MTEVITVTKEQLEREMAGWLKGKSADLAIGFYDDGCRTHLARSFITALFNNTKAREETKRAEDERLLRIEDAARPLRKHIAFGECWCSLGSEVIKEAKVFKDMSNDELNERTISQWRGVYDMLCDQRKAALARAEKAEAWIRAHENYLGEMKRDLCGHPRLGVLISDVQEWFNTLVWFDPNTTAPEPAEEAIHEKQLEDVMDYQENTT